LRKYVIVKYMIIVKKKTNKMFSKYIKFVFFIFF